MRFVARLRNPIIFSCQAFSLYVCFCSYVWRVCGLGDISNFRSSPLAGQNHSGLLDYAAVVKLLKQSSHFYRFDTRALGGQVQGHTQTLCFLVTAPKTKESRKFLCVCLCERDRASVWTWPWPWTLTESERLRLYNPFQPTYPLKKKILREETTCRGSHAQ